MFEALDLLDGTRVLDFGVWRPAPFGTQLLAELGAVVTKIEPPGGDPMREFSDLYRSLNERKRVVELDLKDATQRERALDLAESSDVVVEGFRPGVAARLGVGFDATRARNPGVIYCSVSGFGQEGPLAETPGHDLNYRAWSGMLAAGASEVDPSGVPVADLAGGVYAALAICAALARRARTGQGGTIDVSMTDVLVSWATPGIGGAFTAGEDPSKNFPAYGAFACVDGDLTLGVVTEDHFWRALCAVLALDDLAALTSRQRAQRGPSLRARLASAIGPRVRDELVADLLAEGVPVAPVLQPEDVTRHAHARARALTEQDADGFTRVRNPLRFD